MDGLTKFELSEIVGTRASSQDPESLDDDKPISNPVGDWFVRAEMGQLDKIASVADFVWDEPITAGAFPITTSGSLVKRSSTRGKVRLFKRLVDGEVWIEGFDHNGECVYTGVLASEELSDDEPLAKAEVSSQMYKTLSGLRTSLTPDEITAAEKAIKALDVTSFLEIIRRAQVAT